MILPFHPYSDLAALHNAVADAFCELATQCCDLQGRFAVSLSGGSTPKRLYEMLASRSLPWDQIHWFWGDERNVPHDHSDSNYRMVREALLNHVPAPESNIHPVPVSVDDPASAALEYETTIRSYFGELPPKWDLVLLGMGDDAHTASLFPETTALTTQDRTFVENQVPKFDAYRYTLTEPAINSGVEKWFLIAGANKQEAMKHVLGEVQSPQQFPSQLIKPTRWFVTIDAVSIDS